jgi:large subunit ribosomal protein L25
MVVVLPYGSHFGRLAHPGTAGEPQPDAIPYRTSRSDTMATARPTLAATHREVTGKAVNRLRKEGRLPGVVYGHGVDSSNVSIDDHEFELLRKHTGPNSLVDLSVDGKKALPVLINQVQVHPVNRRPLHVDLFLVRMTEELTVDVPLVPIGESPAVADDGGTLLHMIESVRIKALPDHLPQSIEYSIESLVDFDTTIHVRDLTIPGDVTLLTDADEVVAKVQAPRVEVEEEPVAAEGEEAEGEGAEGAEGGAEGAGEGEGAPAADSGGSCTEG